ncbi:MAG: hypothetical protein QM770_00225 [Tepidisphaeraceae bacterium]
MRTGIGTAIVFCWAATALASPRYFLTPIDVPGTLPGRVSAVDLTESGDVLGHLFTTTPTSTYYQTKQPYVWLHGSSPPTLIAHELALPTDITETYGTGATEMNASGVVTVQFTSLGSTTENLWTWTPDSRGSVSGVWRQFTAPSGSFSWAVDASINDAGLIRARGGQALPSKQALIDPHPDGTYTLTIYPDLGGTGGTSGEGLNASGQFVGGSSTPSGKTHAYISSPYGSTPALTDLGAIYSSDATTFAWALDDAGNVVGLDSSGRKVIRWLRGNAGQYTADALSFPAAYASGGTPVDLNSSGAFVGTFIDRAQPAMPYVWTPASGFVNLNTLLESTSGAGHVLTEALQINDAGQIIARTTQDMDNNASTPGVIRWVLLTPGNPGDTNFDMAVNFADLLTLASHYGQTTGATWLTGDFTGDGAVNFNDLLQLAGNYGKPTTGSFAGDWALEQALVPEPTALVAIGLLPLLGRPRRV